MWEIRWPVLIFYSVSQVISQGLTSLDPDPCTTINPGIINDVYGYRSPLQSPPVTYCDYSLPERWYRILSPHGDDMPISCPHRSVCGTENPIWLMGSLPDTSAGIVTRKACVPFGDDCCAATIDIKIRNCTNFLLYKLKPTQFCPSAYCFGTKPVPTTTSTFQSKTTTSIQPKTTISRGDPCTSINPGIINDVYGYRSPLQSPPVTYCDYSLPEKWYRILSPHGDDMPVSCPQRSVCGTENPIWLMGSLPVTSAGIVTRKACVPFGDDCCAATIDIKIRNCTNFLLYKLKPTQFCPSAYCFGTKVVPTMTSTFQSKTTTSIQPTTTISRSELGQPVSSLIVVGVVSAISMLAIMTAVSVFLVIMYNRKRPIAPSREWEEPHPANLQWK